jgi:translation initiation factor 1
VPLTLPILQVFYRLPSAFFPQTVLDWNSYPEAIAFMSTENRKSSNSNKQEKIVYREFGGDNSAAIERAVPDLPSSQQNLRVQSSRAGRKGKTVTIITGFQAKPETLTALLKQLKSQCGAGGTVKEHEIEIQGDHKQKLLQVLTQMGYKVKISGG